MWQPRVKQDGTVLRENVPGFGKNFCIFPDSFVYYHTQLLDCGVLLQGGKRNDGVTLAFDQYRDFFFSPQEDSEVDSI